MYTVAAVEYAAFLYLRALSFNTVLAILKAYFDAKVFTKQGLIDHIEELTDRIPDSSAITAWLKPHRSGYYALDGTWMKYRGREIVLLILFDVNTLDIVSYAVATEESEETYRLLLTQSVLAEILPNLQGFFCDGDPGLLKLLKGQFPNIPIQLCVFHKYSRVGQIIPFYRPKTQVDKDIKQLTEKILFAPSKEEALTAVDELQVYAKEHQANKKVQEVIGVIKRNLDLLLTHYDHPEMSPYNNVLEGFNHVIKRRTRLMKGFKKPINITRWLKLLMVDWRFHPLMESEFKERRGKSPLELAGVELPDISNWMKFIRRRYPKH